MTFVGLDLHKRYITACAIDLAGTALGEVRRMPVALEALLGFLGELPKPVTVAIEATLYWAWLHDHLSQAGYAVRVAHAYQAKLIWQARSKTDPIDARKLAELLRTNLLPVIWMPDAKTRSRRQTLLPPSKFDELHRQERFQLGQALSTSRQPSAHDIRKLRSARPNAWASHAFTSIRSGGVATVPANDALQQSARDFGSGLLAALAAASLIMRRC